MNDLYYTPPTDKEFEEIKARSIEIWDTYDNTHGYRDEKVKLIEGLQNAGDNVMYIIGMFDNHNQAKLSRMLSKQTKQAISRRLISGGTPTEYNLFL